MFRAGLSGGARNGDAADGLVEFGGNQARTGANPVFGCKFKVSVLRPIQQHAHEFIKVLLRFDAMKAACGNEAENVRGTFGVAVTSIEEPVFAAYYDFSERAFGSRIVERQIRILQNCPQFSFLIHRVAQRA